MKDVPTIHALEVLTSSEREREREKEREEGVGEGERERKSFLICTKTSLTYLAN